MRLSRITQNKLSELFKKFRKIPEQQHYDYIAFCKYNFSEIQKLEFDEYIEIKLAYVKALYHIDRSALFYKMADQALVELLNQEKFTFQYKDIYKRILELKAKRLLEEKKFKQAKQLYQNLYVLDPDNSETKKKLFTIVYRQNQEKQKKVLSLAAAMLIVILLGLVAINFIINPFFPAQSSGTWNMLAGILISSIILLSYSISKTYYDTNKELNKELKIK